MKSFQRQSSSSVSQLKIVVGPSWWQFEVLTTGGSDCKLHTSTARLCVATRLLNETVDNCVLGDAISEKSLTGAGTTLYIHHCQPATLSLRTNTGRVGEGGEREGVVGGRNTHTRTHTPSTGIIHSTFPLLFNAVNLFMPNLIFWIG